MTRQARRFTALAKADLNSLLDSDLGGVAGSGWRWLPSLAFGAEHGIIGLHATPSSTPKMTQRAGGDTLAASQTEPGEPSLAAVSVNQGEAPVLEGTAAIHITCGCNVLKKTSPNCRKHWIIRSCLPYTALIRENEYSLSGIFYIQVKRLEYDV